MNKVKIARELVKIAKEIQAKSGFLKKMEEAYDDISEYLDGLSTADDIDRTEMEEVVFKSVKNKQWAKALVGMMGEFGLLK